MRKHIVEYSLPVMIILLAASISLHAQDGKSLPGKVNIASPNAASLGKFGDIPVSYHTGVPQISIPIHEVRDGNLSVQISISYHAGGLKVDEQDSWVGAGWALNAGGVVTRTVKNKPDEKQPQALQQYGHFSDYGMASYNEQLLGSPQNSISYDTEPDLFSFSFNGYSGKFYFNDDRTPILVPESDLKIETVYVPGTNWGTLAPGTLSGEVGIQTIVITTPDGTKYYFGIRQGETPTCTSPGNCQPVEVTVSYNSNSGLGSLAQPISSWYLHKIVSANGNNTINLYYERDKYAFYTYSSSVNGLTLAPSNQYEIVKNFVSGVRLREIRATHEKVEFEQGTIRQDLSKWETGLDENITDNPNQISKTLGTIKLLDNAGTCYKKFALGHGYFVNTTPLTHYLFTNSNVNLQSDTRRLKLLSIQEQTGDGTVTKPAFSFDYFIEPIARRMSFSKDHWGYNNGATTNQSLYPLLTTSTGAVYIVNGNANRDAVWPAMRAGTLKQITYPTGGRTEFEFEPHTFAATINGQMADRTVGGLRIKSISNIDPATNQTIVTNYSYQYSNNSGLTGLSSGLLFGKPVYIQVFRSDWFKRTNLLPGLEPEGCWPQTPTRPYIYHDNPIRPMETTQGNHIGYEEVKVSQTNNGHVVYKYKSGFGWTSQQIDRDGIAVTFANTAAPCSSSIPSYPSAPPQHNFTRGNLESETFYNNNGEILKAKQYTDVYVNNPVAAFGRLEYGPIAPSSSYARTFYSLKTARKVSSAVTELTYQPGGGNTSTLMQQAFESPYHHQPTKIITTNSMGESIEKRIKYSFDYRVPLFENIQNCNTATGVNGSYDFLTFLDNVYFASFQQAFLNCNSVSCQWDLNTQFHNATFPIRKTYINCRRTNYTNTVNTYQTNHDVAKNNAGPELKTILWMQDNNMHFPIETSEWKSGNLLAASYSIYNNKRNDTFGIYPEKVQRINITTPTAAFTPSVVATDNINITKDSRYKDEAFSDFNKGNIISIIGKDGVATSYEWRYSQKLPVVEVVNAVNNIKEQAQIGPITKTLNFQLGTGMQTATAQQSFLQVITGNITISLSQPPNGAQVTGSINITGPQNRTASLCIAGTGGTSCSTTPATITFANMPPGQYNITYNVSTTFGSFTFNYTPTYVYHGTYIIEAGTKEFFYDGFEEAVTGNIVTGPARTGKNYFGANYTNTFTKPNARNYTIQWWNYSNGKWNFNSSNYTNGMVLTGPVDDVRIFPTDAYMTSYTYDLVNGITSQTDANGRTIYYEYDLFNRLLRIRDQDNNIAKQFDYKYNAGGFTDYTPTWQPTGISRCKPCPQNNNYSMNFEEREETDVNPNSPTVGTKRWIDVGPGGACSNVADWQIVVPNEYTCEKDRFNNNTGFLLYKYKDMNPCSSTYAQFMWVGNFSSPSAMCPVSGCSAANCTGPDKKCISNICETGVRVNTATNKLSRTEWECTYHYQWSDGSRSKDYTEILPAPCI
jgi:YD repeat-containing protein